MFSALAVPDIAKSATKGTTSETRSFWCRFSIGSSWVAQALPAQSHIDVLDLRAGKKLLDRLLAADARLLDPAERHADVVRAGAVDPDVARLDFRGEAVGAVEIVRPDRRREPHVERVHPRQQ